MQDFRTFNQDAGIIIYYRVFQDNSGKSRIGGKCAYPTEPRKAFFLAASGLRSARFRDITCAMEALPSLSYGQVKGYAIINIRGGEHGNEAS